MLISTAYFKGSLYIPNINTQLGNGETPVSNKLSMLIEVEEEQLLVELLGYAMYQDLIANQNTACNQQLLCGADFIDSCGRNNHWNGLIECNIQQCLHEPNSLISKHIWIKWMDLHSTVTTQIGEVKPNTDNGQVVYNWSKYVDVYNKMVSEIALLYDFLSANKACFPLWSNKTCKQFKRINTFGL